MQKAKLIGIAPQLVVKDVVTSATYYIDVLGFNLIAYFLDPPVYAMVERDGFQIHFAKADIEGIKSNEHYRSISSDFIIWVPDIDLFYEEVSSKSADIIEHLVTRVYGSREFAIRDCDGHKIMVSD